MKTIRKAKVWPEEMMKVAELKKAMAPYNPRVELTPDMPEYQAILQSIEDHGFVDHGIVFNKRTKTLVGGHQRVTILEKEFGLDEVPTVVVDVDVWQEKAMNIALNNERLAGKWDMPKLQELLDDIQSHKPDVAIMTGFSSEDISRLLNENKYDKLPEDLETFDDTVPIEHTCPKCGYKFS